MHLLLVTHVYSNRWQKIHKKKFSSPSGNNGEKEKDKNRKKEKKKQQEERFLQRPLRDAKMQYGKVLYLRFFKFIVNSF